MLSERANETLRPLVMTLRVIVIALSLGVLSFGVYASVQNAARVHSLGTKINLLLLGMAGPLFLAGFIVPRLLPRSGIGQQTGTASNEPEEAAAVREAFTPIQTATIVGCALFEGAAFANLVAYMQQAELVHLAVAGIAFLCIAAHFPLTGRISQQIDDRLQAQRDQQQFSA